MTTLSRLASWIVHRRDRLPPPIGRLIDRIAKRPDGYLGRAASLLLGGGSSRNIPPPTPVPTTAVRVYIGPTNYAGQGRRWAAALEAADPRIGARNAAVEVPGGFSFPSDTVVPLAIASRSSVWQRSELAAVKEFSHVLIEAERPLFGTLFRRDVAQEIEELRDAGISCALLSHGTDLRDPRRHIRDHRWSPYLHDPLTPILQADVEASLALIESAGLPVFVSTPDLLDEVPGATWCPVVVDTTRWSGGRDLWARDRPVVVHIPSRGAVKGTDLIEPVLRELVDDDVIDYRSITGVPSSEVPMHIRDADIVLDQFRLGSYGVGACEGMAAGRVVVGNVDESVRDTVRLLTGWELPIVQADPDSLGTTLRDLVADRASSSRVASNGAGFVAEVHSGPRSASALINGWIGALDPPISGSAGPSPR